MVDVYEDLRGSTQNLQKEHGTIFGLITCMQAM